jgi:hypothetical protein
MLAITLFTVYTGVSYLARNREVYFPWAAGKQ